MPENNNEDTYTAKPNDEKEKEQNSAEKAGSLVARGALDYVTGGQMEKFRNMPIVGNKLKNFEDKVGKRIGKIDKLSGGKIGKAAKKLDDSGTLDAADKGLSMVGGGATPEGDASSLGNVDKAGDIASAIPGDTKDNSKENNSSDENSESSEETKEGKSSGNLLSSLSGFDLKKLIKDPKFIAICGGVFLLLCMIGGVVSILASSNPDGSGTYNDKGDYSNSYSSLTGGEFAAKLVSIAEGEIGNNEANGTHQKYLSFLGFGPSTAWCAAFVSWCANEAGIDISIIPHTASVSSFLSYFTKQDVFQSITSDYKPVPGDLIIWKAKGRSHIGIVKEYDQGNDRLITIEGNSSNAVRQNIYSFSSLESHGVVGFAHPNYPVTNNEDDSEATNLSGRVINIPNGLGTHATREFDLASTESEISYSRSQMKCCRKITNPYAFPEGSSQRKVQNIWIQNGAKHDSKGFCKLQGRYVVATTSTFGTIGTKVDFYMSSGTVLHVVLGDSKAQTKAWYDLHPANKWGHSNGKNIIEFMGKNSIGDNPYYTLNLNGQTVVKAVIGGSILN